MEPVSLRARARVRRRLRGHLLREGARLRARRPADARRRCPPPVPARFDGRAQPVRARGLRRTRCARRSSSRSTGRVDGSQRDVTRSSSSRASAGRCASTSFPSPTATRSCRTTSSAASARSARACATRSPRGSCACRSCAPSWDELEHSFGQSVSDLAALRMRSSKESALVKLPAAGMPWFMTVFGRDTIITCLQTLLFGPELARNALEALADAPGDRGRPVDRRRAGQDRPRGAARQGGRELVRALLRHRRRDAALPRPALGGVALDRRHHARAGVQGAGAARARVDRPVRRPRRRRLRRVREAVARTGSTSSRGRTRATRSASTTAASRRAPIAPCEVQGYVYDAKRRLAEIAREVVARPRARRPARARGGRAASGASTRRSGSRSAAASTRSRSTATSSRSTRSARTSGTCSGRGSSRRSASTRSSTS